MPGKKAISFDEEFNGLLLGLASQVKEYQLSWHLNRTLNIHLKRGNDIEIIQKKKNKTSVFSLYRYEDVLDRWKVFVVSNKYLGEFLIPEVRQADYFFIINGDVSVQRSDEIHLRLKNNPVIQMIMKLEYKNLKSKRNLIFD